MPGMHDLADDLPVAQQQREERDEIGERLFRNMLANLQTLHKPSNRPIELRSSGLPFCPIKSFLLTENTENYKKDHYVSTGTAIHETLQYWLPKGDYKAHIFGDWKCSACGRMKRFQLLPGPCKCRSNSAEWLYKELEIKYKKLTGHVDLVLQLNLDKPPFRYVVVDFKSTDMLKKRSNVRWDPLQPSSRNYVVQVRTYCTLLQLEYQLNIVGWLLPSINRAEPITSDQHYNLLSGEWTKRQSLRWIKYLDAANYDFTVLKRLLRHIADNNPSEANEWLVEMVKTRPCHSMDDYKKWMHYSFYGTDVCPMQGICTKGKNKPVLAHVRQLLRQKS